MQKKWPALPLFVLGLWVLFAPQLAGQRPSENASFWEPDSQSNPKRVRLVGYTTAVGFTSIYTGLAVAWYGNDTLSSFRWFDDRNEWLQLDKVGHIYGAYQESRLVMDMLKWAGASRKTILLYGGLAGFVFQSPVELFDGFSPKYGASWSDLAANAAGSGLAVLNEALWQEQRLALKFSFSPSPWASQNPRLLGRGVEQLIKDYNGQTYWLCLSLHPFLPEGKAKRVLPPWLGLAIGYGGEGMIGGYGIDPDDVIRAREKRQFYLSLDIDLTRIRTRSHFLRTLLSAANCIRVPLPALEFGPNGTRFHPVFY